MSQPPAASALPYAYGEVTPDDRLLATWTVSPPTGTPTSATGRCPRCAHVSVMPVTTKVLTEGAAAPTTEARQPPAQPPPEPLTLQFVCTCGEAHAGRPAGTTEGCGAWWLVELEPKPDGTHLLGPVRDRSHAQAAIDLRAAAATQAADVRAAAEKWLTGISALYGLFGLAGVIAGRDTVSALGTAGKAGVAAAALTGLAAAGGAILCGYRAAYGWPVATSVADDTELARWKEHHDEYAFTAATDLHRAVALAVAAVAALVLTVGLIWFLPAEPSGAATTTRAQLTATESRLPPQPARLPSP